MDLSHSILVLARDFQRVAFSKTSVASKVGRAITSKPAQELSREIALRVNRLGGTRQWRKSSSMILSNWVLGRSGHADTTLKLLEEINDSSTRPEQLFVLSKITCSIGLFEVGYFFEERAKRLLRQEMSHLPPSRAFTKLLQLAIHEPDAEKALRQFENFANSLKSASSLPASSEQLLRYVSAWLSLDHHILSRRPLSPWEEYVNGASVVIYGPGNVPSGTPGIKNSEIVARIAGPGTYSWEDRDDLARSRTNIVYLIPETLSAIGESNDHRANIFGRYEFVCVKRGEAPYIGRSRRVEAASLLFMSGHPNMVPLAVIDILSIPGSRVRVIGSDFFASGSSYRPDSIRTTPDGRPQTNQGSSGNRYDRSTLMASHNAFQNRRLVKNLLDSGRITGDDAFLEACSLSDLDYARRLDLHYGQRRL